MNVPTPMTLGLPAPVQIQIRDSRLNVVSPRTPEEILMSVRIQTQGSKLNAWMELATQELQEIHALIQTLGLKLNVASL